MRNALVLLILLFNIASGQEQFQKFWRFQTNTVPNYIGQSTRDSSLFIGGTVRTGTDINNAFISKWDDAGNLIWAKRFNNPSSYQFTRTLSVLELKNGSLFCFIRFWSKDALIALVDSSGQMKWNKKLNCLGNGSAMTSDGAIETSDSSVVVFGSAYCQGENRFGFVLKLDYSGNIIWDHRYKSGQGSSSEFLVDVIETRSSRLVATGWGANGDLFFLELDASSGQVLNSSGYTDSSGNSIYGLEVLPNKERGYDVLLGLSEVNPSERGFGLLKLDSNLQQKVGFTYSYPNHYIEPVNLMHDIYGNIFVYSGRRDHNATFDASMSIARINLTGDLIWHKQFPNLRNHGWESKPKGAIMGLDQRLVFMASGNNPWGGHTSELKVVDREGYYLCDTVPSLRDSLKLNEVNSAPRSFSGDFFTVVDSAKLSAISLGFDTTNCFCAEPATVSDSLYYCVGDTVKVQSLGGSNHTWSPNVGLSCYDCPEPLVFSDSSITYQVISDPGTDCQITHQVLVTVNPLPGPEITGLANRDTLCEGETLTLSPNVTNYDSLKWSTADTSSLITIDSVGVYSVIAFRHGCVDYDTIEVYQSPQPTLVLSSDTGICLGDSIILKANGVGNTSWDGGSNQGQILVTEPNRFYVARTENYCGYLEDSVFVYDLGCSCTFLGVNVFTPNSDQVNDIFRVNTDCDFEQAQLEIFNRWGQLVYSVTGTDPYWDGSSSTGTLPDGVYFYRFTGSTLSTETATSGFVHLLR